MIKKYLNDSIECLAKIIALTKEDIENIKQAKHDEVGPHSELKTKLLAAFETNKKALDAELVNGIDTKALREQTDAFESFFVKMVLDIAIKTENPLFGKDAGDEIYGSMYRQTMSEALSGGFGFSDMIYDYLLERAK